MGGTTSALGESFFLFCFGFGGNGGGGSFPVGLPTGPLTSLLCCSI